MRSSSRAAIGWALIAAFVAWLAWDQAHAYRLDVANCTTYADIVYNVAVVRDLGADEAKHEARVVEMARGSSDGWIRLLRREVRRIYREKYATPDDLRAEAYRRCVRNLGDLGEPS